MYKVFENDIPPVVITFKSIVITKHLKQQITLQSRTKKKQSKTN